ncbi:AAA domain (Cdc48 subfamily) [Tenacibaculum mesophilum]|uniref:ATP-dependent Clp protease ATP-binding subunit n=1 Tax=Tenacibaculum mesophilum TaxID=104268 RepID=A0ABM7CIL3_9FLAO|nr:AAA family ATPase [Tenacibaculum mesophilum]AZJ33634.1 ATP-dependent Clp protease ATP-binding subunit [Tenacibaculum mesophilum]QFS28876.1 AAA domain-containing protein [Tenacibaculum mesophilum]SHF56856.1 AAA domain (Cdc48 subfamily) [Tenacibaculum mesophilum]
MNNTKPRWLQDFRRFVPLKSQFFLSGNIKDFQLLENDFGSYSWHRLENVIDSELKNIGYTHVVYYNPLSGFDIPFFTGNSDEKKVFFQKLQIPLQQEGVYNDLQTFNTVLQKIIHYPDEPIGLIVDFASQFLMNPENLVKAEHDSFSIAHILSQTTETKPYGNPPNPYYNIVIWLVDKEGDLPDWMVVNNPKIRHIPIGKPNHIARRRLVHPIVESLSKDKANVDALVTEFVEETEGLLLLDLVAIIELARSENIPISMIADAVRRYKVGVTEDPWMKIQRSKIENGEAFIKERVIGQDHSVQHIMDIVKRAITGVGNSKRNNRPRGVVFLAGPTGVGKTELAKTLTSLLFGDESAYIRFDMSEFSAEHSDQRLIGAPPGYVGYDVGGELTNAIREKPFSVVLFDEIEKAHPRILDKFLQILDDGVLTSGRGDTVYFSETLIIFTSNLGIYKNSTTGERLPNVTYKDSFETVEKKVRHEIERYFKFELNRPELLNRIGDNIIIFDYIRKDVGEMIFDMMMKNNIKGIQKQLNITLNIHPTVMQTLKELSVADLNNGGRGIRNKIEYHFISPFSRALFSLNPDKGETVEATSISFENRSTTIHLTKK